MSKVTAIVLAAGLSRRMGQPKMLLPWGDTTVLGQVLRTLYSVGADELIVVSGGAREQVEAQVIRLKSEGLPVRAIFNPQYESGDMISSIRVGLVETGSETQFALIALGDQPQLSTESARRVLSAAQQPAARLILPSFEMRRGHPWLVQRDLWPDLITAKSGRAFLRAHEHEILYVDADETVLKDIDTPEDYQQGLNML
jgi:molybdenum cofactor cytidylyltransferase